MYNLNVLFMGLGVYSVCIIFGVILLYIAFRIVRAFWKMPEDATQATHRSLENDSASIKFLKERLKVLEATDLHREIFLEFIRILSSVTSFDDLATQCMETLQKKLGVRQIALFWKNISLNKLDVRFQKGYTLPDDFLMPLTASIAGISLQRHEVVVLDEPRRNVMYVPMPGINESNILCAPIRMFGEYHGVLRIANIDMSVHSQSELNSLFNVVAPLFSSALEKTLVSEQNQKRKNELAAISGITRTLQKTLDLQEICATCARELAPVFGQSFFNFFRFDEADALTLIRAIPSELKLNTSEARSKIMMRNLCSKTEPGLIEDVRNTQTIECNNREIRSIMSIPLTIGSRSTYSLVLASNRSRAWNNEDLPTLKLMAEQITITMERAIYFARQEELAARDGLTGLFNHRLFQERIKAELDRWRRYERTFSLVMFDIDHFKKFNDSYGHQMGDTVLRLVASITQKNIRTTDIAFRYGGEEFAVLLPETSLGPACQFAQRLNRAVAAETIRSDKGALHVTISVGVAEAASDTGAAETLIGAADRAMYCSKDSGRNKVSICRVGKTFVYS